MGLSILLTIGLTARITRLIVADRILTRPRLWLILRYGPDHPAAYAATCAWCLSVWTGAAVFAGWCAWGDTRWWTAVTAAGTASLLTGWAANWIDPADTEGEQ